MIHPTAIVDPHAEIDASAEIGAYAVIEGKVRIGPRTRIFPHAVVTGGAVLGADNEVHYGAVLGDVPPFCIMDGTHTVRAVNLVGLRRAGFSPDSIRAIRNAFKVVFLRRRNLKTALAELEAGPMEPEVRELVEFIRSSTRGVCFGPRSGDSVDAAG